MNDAPAGDEQPSTRASRRALLVGLIIVVLVVGIVVVATRHSSVTPKITIRAVSVTYKVEGSTTGTDITFESPSGTSQQSGKAVPLTTRSGAEGITFSFVEGSRLYLSAQNTKDSGSITCIIEVNGVEVTRNSSDGGFTIATCEAVA